MKYLLAFLVPLLLGCMATPEPDVSRATGQAIFAENCAVCHGRDAKGGGSLSTKLATTPADLTRIAARRDDVWPMLEVMSIVDGYAKRTISREDMPIITGLSEGPLVDFDTGNGLVTPTPARLIAVANYLESIQSPPPKRYVP